MVSGYMNRGIHEGEVGVAVYYYNTIQNSIEEQIFIPYDKSSDILIKELENLCYLNLENHLFMILEGSLYDINLEQKNYELVISDLTEDTYKVSKSGRMIGWLKENKPYGSRVLCWMNLNDGKLIEIKSDYDENSIIVVRPKTEFTSNDTLNFTNEFCSRMFKEGYEIGMSIDINN